MNPYAVPRLFSGLYEIVRSGIKPDQFEDLKWYDRLIRIVGGLMIATVFIGGLIILVKDTFLGH